MRVITLARKPLVGGVAENVMSHDTGGLNIGACRIGVKDVLIKGGGERYYGKKNSFYPIDRINDHRVGRFPSNVILEHKPGCKVVGTKKVTQLGISELEEVPDWECKEGCPVAELDDQSGEIKGTVRQPTGRAIYPTSGVSMTWNPNEVRDTSVRGFADEGGASRFFKQVKS